MSRTFTLPSLTAEDAQARITEHLLSAQKVARKRQPGQRLQVAVPEVISQVLKEIGEEEKRANPPTGPTTSIYDPGPNSGPFYEAVWDLCSRGILYPCVLWRGEGRTEFTGHRFELTSYGEQWLDAVSGYECVPFQYGRFGGLLAGHVARFGSGYHVRSQEALACYRAHTYLACCAMCGAAAESILLALAIAKVGDEEAVLREYRSARGRTAIEHHLAHGQNSHVQAQLSTYTALLNYWRDEASHGAASEIDEEEAFVALINLLRFAHFADNRWDELTGAQASRAR